VSELHQDRGFAIALLLWMIAGMSLMVAAVIHFARADIGMAELRVREAKAQALGRGVAHLLLRDSTLATYSADTQTEDSASQKRDRDGSQDGARRLFSKRYQFVNGWAVSATLRPSNGYVSLNNADRDELMMLFTGIGEVAEGDAAAMVEGVMAYRSEFPGFRYPEELLAVQDSSRVVYDKVKAYLHAYRTGSLAVGSAASKLADLASGQDAVAPSRTEGPAQGNASGRGRIEGRITFESIAEAIRNPDGAADLAINAAELEISLPEGIHLEQTVWVSGNTGAGVLRSGPVSVKTNRRGK